ncbi:MAG TPA: hypothetical protein VHY32_05705 [Caulobacteraceae bacterium]|jgi:hypothetical protein|nr:hypothetical protein [Caulobacteraceae bacterium]
MTASPVRFIVLAALGSGIAAGLSGCVKHHPRHLHDHRPLIVGARLDCPDAQGSLIRTSISADANRCEYRRDDGEQVSLVRLPLNGQTPQAGLAPIEASLKTLLPPRQPGAPADPGDSGVKDGDNACIDVPGVHIDAHGDKAVVRVLGVTIDADSDKANVHAGLGGDKAVVSADQNGAEIRAIDQGGPNANLVLVLASERPGPTGLHSVGYMARGPASGPLVVAEFKNPRAHVHSEDDHDIRRLLDKNLSR